MSAESVFEFNSSDGRSLLERFFETSGLQIAGLSSQTMLANTSPGVNEALFVRNYLSGLDANQLPPRKQIVRLFKTLNIKDEDGDTMFWHPTLRNVVDNFRGVADFVRMHAGEHFFENDIEALNKKLSQHEGELNRYLKNSYRPTMLRSLNWNVEASVKS